MPVPWSALTEPSTACYDVLHWYRDRAAGIDGATLIMEITYSKRSAFLEPCVAAIREQSAQLDEGEPVQVTFDEIGGYDGRIVVIISRSNRESFCTDWAGSDPTRFPARIRAAATALLECGCEGAFVVSHESGSLTIRPA
jgi:hypothetical protein